jgi:hypothetical protein
MSIREQLTELVERLPEEHLQKAYSQLAALLPANKLRAEELVFDMPEPAPPQNQLHLPFRLVQGKESKVEIKIGEEVAEYRVDQRLFRANTDWWFAHGQHLAKERKWQQQFIAVSQEVMFTAVTYEQARTQALHHHPHDIPYVFYYSSLNHEN